jgi:hypothetical protein
MHALRARNDRRPYFASGMRTFSPGLSVSRAMNKFIRIVRHDSESSRDLNSGPTLPEW